MISIADKKELQELLGSKKNILITTHTNPDGDAVGSSLAMMYYLLNKGHNVQAVVPNKFPDFLGWLPGASDLLVYESDAKNVQKLLEEADLVFCLDYNALNRVGSLTDVLARSKATRILIDHHIDPELDSFKYIMSDVSVSSTAELVYDFIESMGDTDLINKEIAEALYTGIVTDTGSFSFAANTAKPYNITAELINYGIDPGKIHRLIYDTFSENRLRLLGHSISNRMIVWDDFHTAVIYLTKEDLKKYDYQIGDAEGIVNYPLMMDKVNMAVLLSERDNQIRISFRSKGDFSVNDLARNHFKGGGHRNAAGGRAYVSMEETIKRIKTVLKDYKLQLDYKLSYS